jgi:hypothetical protein
MRKRAPTAFALLAALAICTPDNLSADAPSEAAFVSAEDGTLVHLGSGLRFPSQVADFRRSEAAAFAENGDYVGLEYRRVLSIDGELTIRIAVVTLPGLSAREHYVITRPLMLQGLEDSRPVAEGVFRRVAGSEAYRGLFTGEVGGVPWMRGLWTFEHGDWDLRVRADFPRIDQVQADEAVAAFVTALNALNAQEWSRDAADTANDGAAQGRRPGSTHAG